MRVIFAAAPKSDDWGFGDVPWLAFNRAWREIQQQISPSGEPFLLDRESWVLQTDHDYYNHLAAQWATGEPFLLVEQDNVVSAEVLQDLLDCPNPHCGRAYMMTGGGFSAGFGCTKFSAELIAGFPKVWQVLTHPGYRGEGDPKHWDRLDSRFNWILSLNLTIPCTHWPAIPHLHEGIPGDPYEVAAASPNPAKHVCVNGHFCRCIVGYDGHACPIRTGPGGTEGALCHVPPWVEARV